MTTRELQSLLVIKTVCTQAVAALKKTGAGGLPTGFNRNSPRNNPVLAALHKVLQIVDRLEENNPVFHEEVPCVTCSGEPRPAPPCPDCGGEGTLTIPRPFADVLEGFAHAVSVKGTELVSGESTVVGVLTTAKAGRANDSMLKDVICAALYARNGEKDVGWTTINTATVVEK